MISPTPISALQEKTFHQKQATTIEKAQQKVGITLNMQWDIVITANDPTCDVRINEHEFFASMPVSINNQWFTIIVSWNLEQIRNHPAVIDDRVHPFWKNGVLNTYKDVHPTDITKSMQFSLLNQDDRLIKVPTDFFTDIRMNLPTSHPLSLIQTI